MIGTRWSKEHGKLAFHLYCQVPFGTIHQRNHEVMELARLIGRTPGAVAMKMVNFASLDPEIRRSGRAGLGNVSELDREIWQEFHADWERLTLDCARSLQALRAQRDDSTEDVVIEVPDFYVPDDFTGETRLSLTEQRMKQQFFRRAVISSYRGRCCMSGISDLSLLNASHIVAWKENKANRLNPSNGLCLSALHDRAFDRHLVSLTDDLRVLVGSQLKKREDEPLIRHAFLAIEGFSISVPERFRPDPGFVTQHRESFMAKNVCT